MPIRDNREYRNIGTFAVGEDNRVTGYASTFDRYELFEDDGVRFFEQIDRHAFDEADMTDVVFLRDHTGAVLARTKNGSVEVWTDDHGLAQRTDLSLTAASRAMLEDIKVGNYSQMSFSFVIEPDTDRYDWIDDRNVVRTITRIKKVYDVSAVAFPANPYTDIGLSARSLFDGAIEQREAERLLKEKAERARKALQLRVRLMKGGK